MTEESTEKTPQRKRPGRLIGRSLLVLLLIVVMAVGSLYIPGVFNGLAKKVLPSIEESAGLRISAENIALGFPLNLRLEDLLILDIKASGDTMLSAHKANLKVNPAALIVGKLSSENATIVNGLYRMGGVDSLFINARMDSIRLNVNTDLSFSKIKLTSSEIIGGCVDLIMGTAVVEKDSVESSLPMELLLNDVKLRNVLYSMYMGVTDDTIYAHIRDGHLVSGKIFAADTVSIGATRIDLAIDSALYGKRGVQPLPGLDFSHLFMRDAAVRIDSFQMRGTELTMPVTSLSIKDLAGMNVLASGTYAMTEKALYARDFDLQVNDNSHLSVNAMMGLDTIASPPVMLDLMARLHLEDMALAFPAMRPLIAPMSADAPLDVSARLSGTMARLDVDSLSASMPSVFSISGDGMVGSLDNIEDLKLDVDFIGRLENSREFSSLIPQGVNIPPLTLQGNIAMQGNDYSATLDAVTSSGFLALNGKLAGKAPDYSLSLVADSLQIDTFVPDLGVGAVSASVNASGRGFNFLSSDAAMKAVVKVDSLEYNNHNIRNVSLDANLENGCLGAQMNSLAPAANFNLDLTALLNDESVNWQLGGKVNHVDLHALGLSDSIMDGTMQIKSNGYASMQLDSISAVAELRNVKFVMGADAYSIDSLDLKAQAGEQTRFALMGNDMQFRFNAEGPLSPLLDDFSGAASIADLMIAERNLAVDSLIRKLPRFELDFYAKSHSPIQQFLRPVDVNFMSMVITARKDSVLTADAQILRLSSIADDSRLDTVTAALTTRHNRLLLDVNVKNRPGTLDALASVGLRGMVQGNSGKFFLRQQNIQGDTGYKLGFLATMADSVIGLQFTPIDPVIAYKNWVINDDNYVAFNPSTLHLYANLDARGGGSRIRLLTSETDSLTASNEVQLKVDDVRLQDWLQINPFAPPIAGNASADMTIAYSDKSVTGDGTFSLDSVTYGRKRVGDFNLSVGVATDFGGSIYTNLGLDVNGQRAFYALGSVNDTIGESPLNMYMRIKEFPLDIVNPFLPKSTAQLAGTLSGTMDVGGRFDGIKLNGELGFSQAKVEVGMMGSTFSLDSVKIPVTSNIVKFNDFAIYGSNQNPLRVNGDVDLRRFEIPRVDLNLSAQNMQFVNSKKGRGIELFGRGFIDLDASVKGSLSFLNVKANLAILPETNLTYQMSDASVAAGLQPQEEVVRFVNFADTSQTVVTDSIVSSSTKMMLSALIDIRQGSQFTVNLSADGTNRAHVKGQGILDYNMSPIQPEGRLTGRFTIDDGSFRYSLPIISEKLFTLQRGSYIAFNGDILNPTLGITATDQVRASVTRAGENSRLVNFDVSLNASGTPERLNVAFDLSASDDLTIANELQGMSANQRANQAMNLLLYGVYSGSGSSTGVNLSGNALYGFLASQLNSWAAKSIKGVDLSFGVDQYGSTIDGASSSAMQYSYKVSKTLFNDRFKIVVGGNYSTDADAEENFAQNLISDISFEYMLNRSGSMYVRLFRKTGFESILEGEVTRTGAGFVVRRKIRRIADIFNFTKAAEQ